MSQDIESSFLLFETFENEKPSGHASGCLVEYKNKKYFFSVEHAVKKANFYLQKKYIPNSAKTKLLEVGQFNRIGKLIVNEQISQDPFLFKQMLDNMVSDNLEKENIIDFAYKEITDDTFKLNCFFQLITQENFGTITREIKKKYFDINQKIIPKKKEICKFAGFVLPTIFPSRNGTIIKEYCLQKAEIEFLGEWEQKEGYYKFKSLKSMIDDKFYKGCSGSPIVNSKGQIVALVNEGCASLDEIYGISIEACKKYIDLDIIANNALVK